jgi:hypothetical protein
MNGLLKKSIFSQIHAALILEGDDDPKYCYGSNNLVFSRPILTTHLYLGVGFFGNMLLFPFRFLVKGKFLF